MFSETRYALNGDLRVAYRTSREGPRDIVYIPAWFTCCRQALALSAAAAILAGCGAGANTGSMTTTKVTPTTTDRSTTTTTTTTTSQTASDEQIADAAKQYLLTGWFMQPPDGDFKNAECHDATGCWAPYIDDITFSGGVLYLHMDTDWTYQPDAALMMMAQNRVVAILWLGDIPAIVLDNVRSVQAVDKSGETTSSATPLHR